MPLLEFGGMKVNQECLVQMSQSTPKFGHISALSVVTWKIMLNNSFLFICTMLAAMGRLCIMMLDRDR